MTSLSNLQKNFISDCLSGELTDDNVSMESDLDTSNFSAKALMGIYRDSSLGNIIIPMKLTYPVILKLVGEDFFQATCHKYIEEYWPATGNMDDYGAEFAEFLEIFEPAKTLPYLPDIARLEWLFHLSSLSEDSDRIDPKALSEVPQDKYSDLHFVFHPSVYFLSSKHPIHRIWEMSQEGAEEKTLDLDKAGGAHLVLVRPGLKVDILELVQAECEFLKALYKEKSLYEAFDIATEIDKYFDLGVYVKKHVANGVFSNFTVK